MGAGHAPETAVVGAHVLQVVGDDGQAVMHRPALEAEVVGGLEGGRAAVQPRAYRPLARPDDVEVDVVQPELVAKELGHVGGYGRVVYEVAVILAPVEQRHEPVGAHVRRALGVDTLVQHAVEPGHLLLGQRLGHDEVAFEVEQVALVVVHGLPPAAGALTGQWPRIFVGVIRRATL